MTPYGDVIHDHSRHPRNYGALDAPDVRHEDVNPFCGDRVRIELSIADGSVAAARFQGDLCVIAKAASSLLTEMIVGMSVERAEAMPAEQLFEALHADIQPARRKCVLLPLEVLQTGVANYRRTG